jgi:hypothetical protein
LASIAALLEKIRVRRRIALIELHPRVPVVGDIGQTRIQSLAQIAYQLGERLLKYWFASTESVSRRVDVAAEISLVWIKRNYLAALIG